jgi:hypothetical protein
MAASKNAALSGIDIYKVGLNVLVFALTPIIVTPIIERLSLYIECWGNYVPDIYDVGKALLLEQDSDEAAAAAWSDRMAAMRDGCRAAIDELHADENLAPG